jgi:hypothetical protein
MGQSHTSYDVVVKIELISSLTTGVPILLPACITEKEKQDAITLLKGDTWGSTTIVGILGTYNTGKTFILNKLSGFHCPSGTTISTEGLSFKRVKNSVRDFVVLDTAGMNSPVTITTDKDLSPLADRKSADQFLQSVVYQLSDVFITVVNHISFKEQESLQQLKAKLLKNTSNRSSKKNHFIIVIHNWKECQSTADLDTLFEKQIKKLYSKGKTEITDNIKWYNNNNTRHVCFGDDNYLSHHNLAVIKLIFSWIDSFKANTERDFKFADRLGKVITETLPDYVQDFNTVKVDIDNLLLITAFKQRKPFTFSSESGLLLSSSVPYLEHRHSTGKKIVLKVPGTRIKPSKFTDRIQINYEPTPLMATLFNDYVSASAEHKNECAIIPTFEKQIYTFSVEANIYDTEKATFNNHKGYFIINLPFRQLGTTKEEEY